MLETIASHKYFYAALLILVSILLSKIIFLILKVFITRLTKKTKNTLDDYLLKATEVPVEVAMILVGVFLTIKYYVAISPEFESIVDPLLGTMGVVVGIWLVTRILNATVKWYGETQTMTKSQKTVYFSVRNIFYIIIFIVGILSILHLYGVQLTPVLASLGIGGIAVALALQSTLSNYFASLYITADGSVKIGDYIETESGVKGYVERIGWRSTQVRTTSDNVVIVPNAKLSESLVTNFHYTGEEVNVKVKYGVAYGSDLEKVEKLTLEAARKVMQNCPGGVKSFEPALKYEKFGDSNIEFFVIMRAKDFANQADVIHEFIKEIDKVYKKNEIEISYPVTKVYMEK
jgi:small-conductance mechanosensitive channel